MIIETLSFKLGIGVGTLAGTVFGYLIGHHYKNSYRKDIREAHAEAMDALEHVMTKILENQDKNKEELIELVVQEFQKYDYDITG